MAVFFRNIGARTTHTVQYSVYEYALITIREMLLAAGWTEEMNDGQAGWSDQVYLTLSDGVVSSTTDYQITSTTGGFTGYEDHCITLIATNDENSGIYQIGEVVDDNTIMVTPTQAPPDGWINESGIDLRITHWGGGTGTKLSDSSGIDLTMTPPSGNNQLRFYVPVGASQADHLYIYAYPKGDRNSGYSGISTDYITPDLDYRDKKAMFNGYIDGVNGYIRLSGDVWGDAFFHFGELENVVAADTYPGFIGGRYGSMTAGAWNQVVMNRICTMRMLDHADTPLDGYFTFLGRHSAELFANNTNGISNNRTMKGYLYMDDILIHMANAGNGGYARGIHPFLKFTNQSLERTRPMDVAGNYIHLNDGIVVPRNGPNDPIPTSWTDGV
jgi:hypothetical protein